MKLQNVSRQLTAACRYSYNRLALNYYMYHEADVPGEEKGSASGDLGARFDALLGQFLEGECPLAELDGLRQAVILRMEQATAYTDCFQAHEYVLNRLEGKLLPGDDEASETDEERLAWLMRFIAAPKEAVTVNERIQTVISQLPVRLTKQKFFGLVREGLQVYVGASKKGVDDMLYILRSEALLALPEGMGEAYPDLAELLRRFEEADYKQLDADAFKELSALMEQSGEKLTDYSGELMLLMDLVNDLYVILLTRTGAVMDVAEEARIKDVLAAVRDGFAAGEEAEAELLKPLEGRQETCFEQWQACASPEDLLEELASSDPQAETLRKISLLLSSSSFMPLERQEGEQTTVDQKALERMEEELFAELANAFSGMPRLLVRAVMAKVLSSLPVFFGSLEDVKNYVEGCLDSCADEAEKAVCMRLIRQLAAQ